MTIQKSKNVVANYCTLRIIFIFREHEWFKVDLPAYLFPSLDRDGNSLDEEAINEICEVNYCYSH